MGQLAARTIRVLDRMLALLNNVLDLVRAEQGLLQPPEHNRVVKLHPPALAPGVAVSARQMACLEQSLRYPLTMLVVPAGGGKTTLLARWSGSHSHAIGSGSQPCISWLTLDADDNDPLRFWAYVLAALDTCQPGYYTPLAFELPGVTVEDIVLILTRLINRCAQEPGPLMLVLDDYQAIVVPAIHDSLAFLLQHQPPQLHVIIATSVEPPLPIANLRARGKLLELRANTLYDASVAQDTPDNHRSRAIRQALADRNWRAAAHLIDDTIGAQPLKLAQSGQLLVLLYQIPPDVVRHFPRLCLFYADSLFADGRLAAAEHWLQVAEAALATTQDVPWIDRLQHQIALNRAYTAAVYGDWRTAQAVCRQVASLLDRDQPVERCYVAATYAHADLARGAAPATAARLLDLSIALEEAGNLELAIVALHFAAPLFLAQGRLREVWRMTHQAIQLGSDANGSPTAIAGAAYVYQADVLREWDRLDEASQRLDQGLRLLDQSGYRVLMADVLAIAARVRLARRELVAAAQALDQLAEHPLVVDNPYRQSCILIDEQVRLWLARGDRASAARRMAAVSQEARALSPFAREREDVAHARIALKGARPHDALALLEPLRESAFAAARQRDLVEILMLETSAHQALGVGHAALAALAAAVQLGEPETYIRTFVDAGAGITPLLEQLLREENAQPQRGYIDRIRSACRTTPPGSGP